MTGLPEQPATDNLQERQVPLAEQDPFVPFYARRRRYDGNAILGRYYRSLGANLAKLLDFGPIEFVWTLACGPVAYEPKDVPATPDKVEASITTRNPKRLKELYEHSRGLIDSEEATRSSIEGRANILLGAGGLTATLIVGVSGLLARGNLDQSLLPTPTSTTIFSALYLTGLIALVMSLLRAVQAVRVRADQPFSATRPFEVQEWAEVPKLRRLIREAFLVFVDARELNRLKAAFLRAAQWWFLVGLVALLAMASVPVLTAAFEALGQFLAGVSCSTDLARSCSGQ